MSAAEQPGLRIGDAEREAAQATLGDHYAAGRLDHDEYSQRLDRIWAARTRAELAPVFTDLPSAGGGVEGRTSTTGVFSTATSRRPTGAVPRRRPSLPWPLMVVLVVLGAVVVATNLPWILVGVGVWFFFLRGGGCHGRAVHSRRW